MGRRNFAVDKKFPLGEVVREEKEVGRAERKGKFMKEEKGEKRRPGKKKRVTCRETGE